MAASMECHSTFNSSVLVIQACSLIFTRCFILCAVLSFRCMFETWSIARSGWSVILFPILRPSWYSIWNFHVKGWGIKSFASWHRYGPISARCNHCLQPYHLTAAAPGHFPFLCLEDKVSFQLYNITIFVIVPFLCSKFENSMRHCSLCWVKISIMQQYRQRFWNGIFTK